MSENALDPAELPQSTRPSPTTRSWEAIFWTLLQPTVAMGAPLLVAVTLVTGVWAEEDRMLFALVMIFLPIPIFVWTERRFGRDDWKLKPSELAEDGFWVAMGAFLWAPLITDMVSHASFRGFPRHS